MHIEAFCENTGSNDRNVFERMVEESDAIIVFRSSFEKGLVDSLGITLIRYIYPVFDYIKISERGYAGFNGMLNLVEDIINVLLI